MTFWTTVAATIAGLAIYNLLGILLVSIIAGVNAAAFFRVRRKQRNN